ncbi:MAG: HAD hydrolase family protein, partial [Oscillospiraceae bacterium]|nr:HAD hydrolase family protein [Oscillospiraceae bacterium]
MKTLFISDLDGTLLNSNAEISENTALIINSLIKKGLHFTVATARSERTAIPMTSCLDINVPRV